MLIQLYPHQLTTVLMYREQDLFATKIARIPLKNYFPEFDGAEGDAAAAKRFILGVCIRALFVKGCSEINRVALV